MPDPETRVIAVDWSGDKSRGKWKIWLAEARAGQILRLENGRTPNELIAHLIDEGSKHPQIVVGFDFAFSMPKWFMEQQKATSGQEFWDVVAHKGEAWLRDCPSPFWGQACTTMPRDVELLRRTEREVKELGGRSPSSVFQIAGGSQVGTGSIRGMPFLRELRNAGWKIWPFDPPGFPLVIDIYPRLHMGAVVKSSPAACLQYLTDHFPNLDLFKARSAESNEHAFDAAVSALVMSEHLDALHALSDLSDDPIDRLEGRIWNPSEWSS